MSEQNPAVITVGIHIVDILGWPVAAVPDGQGIALLDEIRMTVAGTGAATAVDLARLGVSVATFGVVGDDELGRWLSRRLNDEGVDTRGLAVTTAAPTSATILPIRPNGERPALHVIGANALLGEEHLDWDVISRAKHLHIGGTSLLAALDGAPTARILQRAQSLGLTTSLDLISVPGTDRARVFAPSYPFIDFLLPNDEDAAMLSGESDRTRASAFFAEHGVGATVISLGADGASYSRGGAPEVIIPSYAVDVVDTTGCGDALSAGFIAGITAGYEPLDAVELGVAAGALVATGLGSDAGLSTREALEAFAASTPRRPSTAASAV